MSSPTPLAGQGQRPHGIGDQLDALALERVPGGAPAEDQRRQEQPDLVDLAGVEERSGQVRPALEQDRGHPGCAELIQCRDDAGRLVLASRDDHVDAMGLQCVGRRPRRRPRDDDRQRHAARIADQLRVERQPAERSNTTRRGWRIAPSTRAVSSGSSASAVPIPTATASHSARQWWARSRLDSPEIHFESPPRVATLPSSVIADLNSTHGRPVRAYLRNGWFRSRARCGEIAVGEDHLDALVTEDPEPASARVLARVIGGDDHTADAGLLDRLGARRRPAVVAAGLQRYVQRRVREVRAAGRADRLDLGVGRTECAVKALAEHVVDRRQHGADQWVGAHLAPALLGELDRAGEVAVVGLWIADGHHCC